MTEIMTKQEIFNKVCERAKFKEKAQKFNYFNFTDDVDEGETRCVYRGNNGEKCFVGYLIPDNLYHKEMENKCASSIIDNFEELNFLKCFQHELDELQQIHDRSPIYLWEQELNDCAKQYGLESFKF